MTLPVESGVTRMITVDPATGCTSAIYALAETGPAPASTRSPKAASPWATSAQLHPLARAGQRTDRPPQDEMAPQYRTRAGGTLRDEALSVTIIRDPDFAALFAACICRRRTCERCGGWQLTPRMASVLWTATQLVADDAYDDVVEHRDDPVQGSRWALVRPGREGARHHDRGLDTEPVSSAA